MTAAHDRIDVDDEEEEEEGETHSQIAKKIQEIHGARQRLTQVKQPPPRRRRLLVRTLLLS